MGVCLHLPWKSHETLYLGAGDCSLALFTGAQMTSMATPSWTLPESYSHPNGAR